LRGTRCLWMLRARGGNWDFSRAGGGGAGTRGAVVSGEWICEGGAGEEDEVGGGVREEAKKQRSKEVQMRVLVTFAVEAEFAPWRKLRNLSSREINGITVHEAMIGRAAVDFVVSGMGLRMLKRDHGGSDKIA